MSTVKVTVDSFSDVNLPDGKTSGKLRFSIKKDANIVSFQDVDVEEASFDITDTGDFTATAQRLDSDGNVLGDESSASFSIGSGTTTFKQPGSLTVTVS